MGSFEEFENYREDKWWWFATYLELGAAICYDPALSAKRTDFLDNFKKAAQEAATRSVQIVNNGSNDST